MALKCASRAGHPNDAMCPMFNCQPNSTTPSNDTYLILLLESTVSVHYVSYNYRI